MRIDSGGGHSFLSTSDEIIWETRNGRISILVDDEDRRNDGHLVMPAQMVTPWAINFMASHGRGLICMALTVSRAEQLRLPAMTSVDRDREGEAFTVSIEARTGLTTGISARDRARTIAVACDPANGPDEIVSPGHVFPLVARDGGVLVRAGHTEAAVDLANLAGLHPAAVLCKILNDDGSVAQLDDLITFSRRHELRVGTVRDLIQHRRLHDRVVEKIAEMPFNSEWGDDWRAMVFRNRISGDEQLAIVKGKINPSGPTLVRMHQLAMLSDIFAAKSERRGLLQAAMRQIDAAGSGVIVIINNHDPDTMMKIIKAGEVGSAAQGDMLHQLRDYGIGAQILADLGVHAMIVLTNSDNTLVALEGYGLSIAGERHITV